jgi:hypothetical protein
MASGKRDKKESFFAYRKRLAAEEKARKEYLKGEFVWVSSMLIPSTDKKYKDEIESLRPLVKVIVHGTYRNGGAK